MSTANVQDSGNSARIGCRAGRKATMLQRGAAKKLL